MRSRIITAAVAGGLLVGAGFVTSLVSSPSVASAQEDDSIDDAGQGLIHRGLAFLSEVLSELVDDGTIDQSEADAITAAVEAKAEDVKAQRKTDRKVIWRFLEDGVITADELAELPDDHPFNDPDGPFAEATADGELTVGEIREAMPHRARHLFRVGARFGALLDDGGIDTEEYEGLGDDHPLKQVDVSEYLEDGLITTDELREIRHDWKSLNPGDEPEA